MFFDSERIISVRKMIVADNKDERVKALAEILPYQTEDFKAIYEEMKEKPVTIRLLDPPLHEFLPKEEDGINKLAERLNISADDLKDKVNNLSEFNPMLGHRGCRLGITYPEITEMQARAIIEAAVNLTKKGVDARPEIMVPLIGTWKEFKMQEEIIRATAEKVFEEKKLLSSHKKKLPE
jgi:pyruvate,orthophosphate dikinase